mgnify:CR=1 FL=1
MKQIVQKVEKPWGHETRWAINDKYLGKILHIKRNRRLSTQYHEIKDETIFVLRGVLIVHVGLKSNKQPESTFILKQGESFRIEPKVIHRFCAPADGFVELVEVSTPEINDVVRLQDDYDRT